MYKRQIKDSLLREDSAAEIVIMGDMNDDPMDKSMAVALGAKRKPADVGPTDLYNPWHEGPVSEPHQHDVPHAEPGRRGRLPDDAHAGFRREGRQQQQT